MINLYDILEAADGQLFGDASAVIFADFCFDSRLAKPGDIYVALKTERGDGHQFMREAASAGAHGLMCQRPPDFDTTGLTVIMMRDVEASLMRWARVALQKLGTTVIAVGGSAGRAAAREAIAAVMSTHYRVYCPTDHGESGRFALPRALGRLSAEDKIAVLDCPDSAEMDMAEFAALTSPLVGVVTDFGAGEFSDLPTHYRPLIDSLPREGLAIVNYDSDRVRNLAAFSRAPVHTIGIDRAGRSFGADFTAYNLVLARDKTGFDLRWERDRFVGRWFPLLGVYPLYGALAALAVGLAYEVKLVDGLNALKDLRPQPGHMMPLEGRNGSLIIDDSFNSSPEATLAALEWLHEMRGKSSRISFLIGDLGDLGRHTLTAHREVGRAAAQTVDSLITHGDLAAGAGRAALDEGFERRAVRITFNPQDAIAAASDHLIDDSLILVTGGHKAHMEAITRGLLANPDDAVNLPRHTPAIVSPLVMPHHTRLSWVEIDKTAIAHNTQRILNAVGPDVALMAVVSANAYGHGAVPVAATALLNGASYLGVSSLQDAIELREAALDSPILVMGFTPAWSVPAAIRYGITLSIYDLEVARVYNRVARDMGATLKVHVEIDSGLGLLGLLPDAVMPFFRSLKNLRNLELEGIYTRFAAETNTEYTRAQLSAFLNVVTPLKAGGYQFQYIHAADTTAALTMPEAALNMVRSGLGLCGLTADGSALQDGLRPALMWKTVVSQVKTLPAGAYVGGGRAYRTRNVERVAIIAAGYGDGLDGWDYVLIGGQRATVIGGAAVDMAAVNVTHIPNANIGDEVVIIGQQGESQITVEEIARRTGMTQHELVTSILARVPR